MPSYNGQNATLVQLNRFYLYRHIRLDKNEPFYIGIGTKINNPNQEYMRAYNKSHRSNWWKKVIAKTEYEVEIILESDNYDFIKEREIEFIKLYGRKDLNKGTLVNLTDGGEGVLNRIITDEERNKRTGKILSEETRNKIRQAHYGIKPNEETRKKIGIGNKGNASFSGKTHTLETKYKISQKKKGTTSWNKGLKTPIEIRLKLMKPKKLSKKPFKLMPIYNNYIPKNIYPLYAELQWN